MKLTDYVAQFLHDKGIRTVFGLTGGAVVHFFDSIASRNDMQIVFTQHEQAASFAAESCAKVTKKPGVCIITTGPGGTNALTGLVAAWQDSVPCLFISGQARDTHLSSGKNIRQLGTQELDIVSMVRSVTKYAVTIESAQSIRYHLEKAYHMAISGRPGPVWIDIPLNYQWENIEIEALPSFVPDDTSSTQNVPLALNNLYERLQSALRPVLVIGVGVRMANAEAELYQFVEKYSIPFVLTWNAFDIFPSDHPLNLGCLGMMGHRGANLAVQQSDLLISVGSHLCIPQTGTLYAEFAKHAYKVLVDIDEHATNYDTIKIDSHIICDAKIMLQYMLGKKSLLTSNTWLKKCETFKFYSRHREFNHHSENYLDHYFFVDGLSNFIPPEAQIVIDGGGTNVYISFQMLRVQKQRVILSSALCSMGSGLPESIGVSAGLHKQLTICLCGDGSMQLNIQELQTIIEYQLPVKIFVFDNGGYLSIRDTQQGFLGGRFVGSGASGGLSLPDYTKIAAAYGIDTCVIDNQKNMNPVLKNIMQDDKPCVCVVKVSANQEISPKQGFREIEKGKFAPMPLDHMYPFLDKEVYESLMEITE